MQTLKQVAKFGTVGLFATATHAGVYALCAGLFGIAPLLANLVAFVTAFAISFAGHLQWTFKQEGSYSRMQVRKVIRFLITALLGLALNSLFTWSINDLLNLHYLWALLPMVALTPAVTFVLSKLWAFR